MKNNNKFLLILITIITLSFSLGINISAAKKASKGTALEEHEHKEVVKNIELLTKKIYAAGLFSPEDSGNLVELKVKLTKAIGAPEESYPRLFYDLAYICKEREQIEDAIQFYKVVTDHYPESPYAKRALTDLEILGVKPAKKSEHL